MRLRNKMLSTLLTVYDVDVGDFLTNIAITFKINFEPGSRGLCLFLTIEEQYHIGPLIFHRRPPLFSFAGGFFFSFTFSIQADLARASITILRHNPQFGFAESEAVGKSSRIR